MSRTLAIVAAVASIPLLALGAIFLIAATTGATRVLPGLAFLAMGGLALAWAALTLRRHAEISPESLSTGIVDLARRLGGEVTVAQVQAEFRIPSTLALGTLEHMRARGECTLERRNDYDAYVFKSVMPAKAVKRCEYCGSSFPIRSSLRQCPNCGAPLEITKE